MYRPVRTYHGSTRPSRKKKIPQPQPQQQSHPQNELILGVLPAIRNNSLSVLSPIQSISLKLQNKDVSMPTKVQPQFQHQVSSRSPSPNPNASKRTMELPSPSNTLINPTAFNPPPFPTPSVPRSRSTSPTMDNIVKADAEYHALQNKLNKETTSILQKYHQTTRSPVHTPPPIQPDGRLLYMRQMPTTSPRDLGIASANPTISQPILSQSQSQPYVTENFYDIGQRQLGQSNGNTTLAEPVVARTIPSTRSSGQDVIIKEQPSINYRETEQNLILYSYDRNWLENTTENRYDFTVNFDTQSLQDGFRYAASVDRRYRNIVRIELVKAIIAAESLENIVLQLGPNSDPSENTLASTDTTYQVSPLSFPYINISLQEFDGNNSGTDENLNRTFANLQYDAQWHTDILHQNPPGSETTALRQTTTRGFLAMIPKYMKCQRVFYPTPLATLSKMSIRLTRPNGQLLSSLPDQLSINNVFANTEPLFRIDASKFGNQIPAVPVTGRTVTYLFIQTPYFPRSAFSQGDRIQLRGLLYDRAVLNSYLFNADGLRNLESWLNRDEGHIIVGLGNNGPNGIGIYQDGPNKIGYANFIIIQSKFVNQDGAIYYESVGNANDIAGANTHFCSGPKKLINMSRQTTIIFRVITRDLDSMTNIRPDNTY